MSARVGCPPPPRIAPVGRKSGEPAPLDPLDGELEALEPLETGPLDLLDDEPLVLLDEPLAPYRE